jgi:hypothetical protein
VPGEKNLFKRMKIDFNADSTVVGTCKLRGRERDDGAIGFSEIQENVEQRMKVAIRHKMGCQNCGMNKGKETIKPDIRVRMTFQNEEMVMTLICTGRKERMANANCYATFPPKEPVQFIVRPEDEIPF